MNIEASIQFFSPETMDPSSLTYVIIGAREGDKWIFVRHQDRSSWELPAGHIEKGESVNDAAIRELYEETGTTEGKLKAIHDYSVTIDGDTLFGRIYFAKVLSRGKLPESEITEVMLAVKSPEPVTYPYAHWKFFSILKTYISNIK